MHKGVFGFHVDHPVESAGAEVRGTRPRHDFDVFHIEVGRAEKVSQGEVEAGTLVVHAVDELQGPNRRRAVESPGVHDLESKGCRRQIDPFQVAQPFVKTPGGRLLDGQGIHGFDRQRLLLLLFRDALADDLRLFHQNLVGLKFDLDSLGGRRHVHLLQRVPNETHVQGHGKRGHGDAKHAVKVGGHAVGRAVHDDVGRKHRLARGAVENAAPKRGLGRSRQGKPSQHQRNQRAHGTRHERKNSGKSRHGIRVWTRKMGKVVRFPPRWLRRMSLGHPQGVANVHASSGSSATCTESPGRNLRRRRDSGSPLTVTRPSSTIALASPPVAAIPVAFKN